MHRALASLLLIAPTVAAAQERELRLEPELIIGAVDDERYALTRVSDLEIGPEGRIYVAQPAEHRIRVFGRNGGFEWYIGGPGEGPGEFRGMSSLGWLRGSLYAIDPRLSRVTLFSAAGVLERSFQMRTADVGGYFVPAPPDRLLPDGTAVARPRVSVQVMGSGQVREVPILRIDRDGLTMDTLLTERWRGTGGAVASEAMALMVPQPLASHDLWSADPTTGSIVTAIRPPAANDEAAHFEVIKRGLDGEAVFHRRFRYRPKRLSSTQADSIVRAAEERLLRILGPRGQAALQANGIKLSEELPPALALPDHQPPVSGLLVGADGRIWIQREEIRASEPRWVLLNPDGTIIGEATGPPGVRLLRADSASAWGVMKDEFDVEYVVRLRITG